MPGPERFRLFRPILAGATLGDRLLASLGALVGIGLTGLICGLAAPDAPHLLWLVPPMGASAVLLFAVPASPMAQPWPVIGGNTISALVGVLIAHLMPQNALAAALAVGLAIAAMSLLRCLHPPGGAAALVGLFAGASSSYAFPFLPVGLNAVVLTASAWAYHRLVSGHAFPHRPAAKPPAPAPKAAEPPWTFRRSDLDAVLDETGETFDIDPDDLERVLRAIERRAVARSYRALTCDDLMARPVIGVPATAPAAEARRLLLEHDVRRVAVIDGTGVLLGAVGLPELVEGNGEVGARLAPSATASPGDPAMSLLPRFAKDRVHAVFVVDDAGRPVGVVTEADWLNVLTRGLD